MPALLSPLSVTLAQPSHLLACPSPGLWESDTTLDSKTRLVWEKAQGSLTAPRSFQAQGWEAPEWLVEAQRVGVASTSFASHLRVRDPFPPPRTLWSTPALDFKQGPGGREEELRKGGREKDAQWSLGESLLTAAQVPPEQIKVIQTPGAAAKPRSPSFSLRFSASPTLTQFNPSAASLFQEAFSGYPSLKRWPVRVPRGPSKNVLIWPVTRGRHRAWTAYGPTHGGLVFRIELPTPAHLLRTC